MKARTIKQYDQLSERERGQLMIMAKIRGDSTEFTRLEDSAAIRGYKIRASREHEMLEFWKEAHKALIMVAGTIQGKQHLLYFALNHMTKGTEQYERTESASITRLVSKLATYQAFKDWMDRNNLPIDHDWLLAFCINLQELEAMEMSDLSDERDYQLFYEILEKYGLPS